ncbi:NUDIX domain-containing protein [Paenibacillus odorifer]|uniref:NUDIX domain-containing protein n=1 Tax=Paenibacillus sp. FSL R5-0923 TaxID=2921666 RepID=UPI0009D753ED
MKNLRYRACSLCIIKRRESILLEQFPEEDGIITFRPVGGTIEYGEDSKSAVIREVKEEINIDIIEPKIDRDYRAHLPLVRRNWT